MELNLHKISSDLYLLTFFMLMLIADGFIFIAVYFPLAFSQFDNYKLTIIASGFTLSICFATTVLMGISRLWDAYQVKQSKDNENASPTKVPFVIFSGVGWGLHIVCLPNVIGFLFDLRGKTGVIIIMVELTLFLIVALIAGRRLHLRKTNETSNKGDS